MVFTQVAEVFVQLFDFLLVRLGAFFEEAVLKLLCVARLAFISLEAGRGEEEARGR